MKYSLFAAALSLCAIIGCSYPKETQPTLDTVSDTNLASTKKIKLICSVPPPPKDTSKLIQNLTEQGIITEAMSAEEVKAKVAEYIYKRQQAFKNCNKGN